MPLNNNAKQHLNLYKTYPIMSLLKVKVNPKFESKLYNYNKGKSFLRSLPHVYLMMYDVSDPTKSIYVKYVVILDNI